MRDLTESSTRRPEALWFGSERARCFGMLHEPDSPSDRGVVFCNAFGFEGLLSYRAYRHLADGLAARGQWALRFDYDGEGNAAGGPWEPHRVDAWIASIDAAVSVLRSRGVTEIRLVGFRIGATLACRYATTHSGISGLVLWAPCDRGAAYVREQRVRARISATARPRQPSVSERFAPDSLEAVGFELAGETLRDLAAIDLLADSFAQCPPAVLVIDRDDAPPADDLVRKLADSGARVEHHQMSGYEQFISDGEENAITPWPAIQGIAAWLDASTATVAADVAATAAPTVLESSTLLIDDPTAEPTLAAGPARDAVVEEMVWADDRFFAVCSRPAGRAAARGATVVLCNTGSVNHVGPGRLYVTVARYWASLGFTVVRVDLGHTGDSVHVDPTTENQPYAAARREELHDVITWVRRWAGNDHVVVGGLCSGAYLALHLAMTGVDIDHVLAVNAGVFYLDADKNPSTSEEHAFHSAHALTRGVVDVRRWKLAVRDREVRRRGLRSVRKLFGANAMSGFRVLAAGSVRNAARRIGLPVKGSSVLAHDLAAIIARGGKVLLVFATGESSARYLRKFGGPECEKLSHGNGLDVVNIEGGDHVFSPPASREELIETLTSYLAREYPSGDATRIGSAPRRRPGRTYMPARVVPDERERPRLPA
jgi:dienelactone hydrolase